MSSPIWTPAALSSERRGHRGLGWRLVEAQHQVSTLKIVDSLAEQEVLEHLIDATKPTVPAECRHLNYLLATPFRYGAPYPKGSRFRRAGLTPGVYYAADAVGTAVAEMVFYRILFFVESPDTPFPANAAEYTAFSASVASDAAIDLTEGRLAADAASWTNPVDYSACQALADSARAAGVQIIRYRSVRDPGGGKNLALLTCRAFAAPQAADFQTWKLRIGAFGGQAICEFPRERLEFRRADFAGDPRLR